MTLKEIIETHRDLCGSVMAYAKEKLSGTSIDNPKVINFEYHEGLFEHTIEKVFLDNGCVCFSFNNGEDDEIWYFDDLALGMQIDIVSEL